MPEVLEGRALSYFLGQPPQNLPFFLYFLQQLFLEPQQENGFSSKLGMTGLGFTAPNVLIYNHSKQYPKSGICYKTNIAAIANIKIITIYCQKSAKKGIYRLNACLMRFIWFKLRRKALPPDFALFHPLSNHRKT